ncbi:MAG TPA: hypothetical protein VFX45_01120, partial [Solirubrobacterales bacterium]|nr:hypothetical protein [Solirubrobacterales bacterium]
MSPTDHSPSPTTRSARLGLLAAALFCLGLLLAASASAATYEQVGCFAGKETPTPPPATPKPAEEACEPVTGGEFGEEVQLGGIGGMAVNYTGAGGVDNGTVYTATKTNGGSTRIAMYVPRGPGEGLEFSLGWEVTELEGPYERCGPAIATECPNRVEAGPREVDVDVDQETGNVYVLNGTSVAGRRALVAYDADGSEVISRFGELAEGGKTIAETPGQIHNSFKPGGIAVNGDGEVFVYDVGPGNFHRLMKFEPETPGDFSEYVYAGQASDLASGSA